MKEKKSQRTDEAIKFINEGKNIDTLDKKKDFALIKEIKIILKQRK